MSFCTKALDFTRSCSLGFVLAFVGVSWFLSDYEQSVDPIGPSFFHLAGLTPSGLIWRWLFPDLHSAAGSLLPQAS